jgi:hypothetical protein
MHAKQKTFFIFIFFPLKLVSLFSNMVLSENHFLNVLFLPKRAANEANRNHNGNTYETQHLIALLPLVLNNTHGREAGNVAAAQAQGCQIAFFQTKNPSLDKFWTVLQ